MASRAYPDSSFLVSIYRQDSHDTVARAYMAKHSPALVFTPLHRLELRNALRFAEAQKLMSSQERRQAFRQIEEDIHDGFLVHTNVTLADICRRADDLSEQNMLKNGQRTIDLLHVAAALESGEKVFLSFERRQRGLAAAAGLSVKP